MMKIREIDLSTINPLMKDYTNNLPNSTRFFDFAYGDKNKYKKRLDHLMTRTFEREKLATYFTTVHENLLFVEEALKQIDKLRQENSVVVVGGQQAGLLTGPLYTVYKAMSIIILAKEQEKKLNVPVIPIFWVAGEDHDLDEIRFVYKEKNKRWKKHMLSEGQLTTSATNVIIHKQELNEWLDQLFSTFPETSYTKSLLIQMKSFVDETVSYVDFFMKVMNWFFGKEGLLLIDAHSPFIRSMEIPFFEQLINHVEHVQDKQQRGAKEFARRGYGVPIETEDTNAHLFIEWNGERRRLDYVNELFHVSGTEQTFKTDELIEYLYQHPEKFSNNVVTRPLMQEWLLPTLAFISGPGELLYWGTLKYVFHHFQWMIPPVIPRLQATFIPKEIEKWLSEHQWQVTTFLEGKGNELRDSWLNEVNPYPIQEVITKVQETIANEHVHIRNLAKKMDPTLAKLSEKNFAIINHQISFMEKKMSQYVRHIHKHDLSKFNKTTQWLFPEERPQERVFHPILLLNMIGIDEFRRFLSTNIPLDPSHKVYYL